MVWRLVLGAIFLVAGLVMLTPFALIWSPGLFGYYTVGLNGNVSFLRQLSMWSALGGAACAVGAMFLARAIGLWRRGARSKTGL